MIKGIALHCHHNKLYEYVYDYNERVEHIKENKPEGEVELRLRLLKMIPDDKLPARLVRAREAYDKAREAYGKAWEAYGKAREAHNGEACGKAWEAYGKAWEAYDKVVEAYDKVEVDCRPEMEKLHKELCPLCPWDGRTIFKEEK